MNTEKLEPDYESEHFLVELDSDRKLADAESEIEWHRKNQRIILILLSIAFAVLAIEEAAKSLFLMMS